VRRPLSLFALVMSELKMNPIARHVLLSREQTFEPGDVI
jgi:hypothetical protein